MGAETGKKTYDFQTNESDRNNGFRGKEGSRDHLYPKCPWKVDVH